jgi:hypothetical protein
MIDVNNSYMILFGHGVAANLYHFKMVELVKTVISLFNLGRVCILFYIWTCHVNIINV